MPGSCGNSCLVVVRAESVDDSYVSMSNDIYMHMQLGFNLECFGHMLPQPDGPEFDKHKEGFSSLVGWLLKR